MEDNLNRFLEQKGVIETVTPEKTPEIPPPQEKQEIPPQFEVAPKKEEKESFVDEAIDNLKNRLKKMKRAQVQMPQVRDEITLRVEKIMEEGLQDAYRELTPIQREEFKIKGEKTAMEIRAILQTGKIKIKKIFKLILEWLRLLPGVNKFFIEQEAKIKADKIISLKDFDN